MKAIRTYFKGPGNVRGARIYATDDDGNRVSIPYDYGGTDSDRHRQAARALCKKMGWRGRLVEGHLGKGHVFVWLGESSDTQPFGVPHTISVYGRRWFRKTYGNTYHTVEITVDGETHKTPPQYGYGDQYLQTALAWLAERGYVKPEETVGHWRTLQAYGITYSVADVARERDL